MIHSVSSIVRENFDTITFIKIKPKGVVLFLETDRVKKNYCSSARIVECVSEYTFLILKNKQAKKKQSKAKIQNKQKKLKKKREYLRKID